MDEQNDIVDQNDHVIATKLRSEVAGDFVNTRYANMFIRNSRGQLWVPFRNDNIKRWPSSPDFAVGGAVMTGEDYLQAILRETQEEIGLTLNADDVIQIAYLSPYKFPIACFSKIYEYVCEDVPFTPGEYKSAQWMDISELITMLSENTISVKTDLLPVLRLCYGSLQNMDRTLFEP